MSLVDSIRMMGFGEALAPRIAAHFGQNEDTLTEKLREDPYILMEVDGIGFIKADNVAQAIFRIKDDDPRRQSALILKTLDDNKNLGHVFLPITILERELKKNKIPYSVDTLKDLEAKGSIIAKGNKIFLKRLHDAEFNTASYLLQRSHLDISNSVLNAESISGLFAGLQVDIDQEEAVKHFRAQSMMVLTGGPGTGKTQTIKAICSIAEMLRMNLALCAPTGKAAKRMQDLTGRKAMTIHRMLKAGWGYWKHNITNQLRNFQLIIVDESSMMDVELAYHFFDAIPPETKIIFVGDVDQLPPVGPGSFFKDLIKSKLAKVVRLKTNHRQGLGSSIADNAIQINQGALKLMFDEDITFVDCMSPIIIREKISTYINMLRNDGYDLLRDVQILTPQHKTNVGTIALNELLRFSINKKASPREKFSIGDKIMQTFNDYELGIFNGYIGAIREITSSEYLIEFFDDDRPLVKYPKSSSDGLMLAYACTIHKYQGSEAKAGIPIICSSHIHMLSRNLLYTAITRFKEKCVILGDSVALRKSIVDNREQERFSDLPNLLEEG